MSNKFILILFAVSIASMTLRRSIRMNGCRRFEATKQVPKLVDSSMPVSRDGLFDWTVLDMDVGGVCGADKCFFRDRQEKEVGYLIAANIRSDRTSQIEEGWKLARYLELKFGVQHFLLGPPWQENVTESISELLSSNLLTWKATEVINQKYTSGRCVIIQKVQVAPEPNAVVKELEEWEGFVSELTNFTSDITGFARNVESGIQSALDIVLSTPLFSYDFQLMFDKKGNVYHLDFDRAFESIFRNETSFKRRFQDGYTNSIQVLQAMTDWTCTTLGKNTSTLLHKNEPAINKSTSSLLESTFNWTKEAKLYGYNESDSTCQILFKEEAKKHVSELRQGGKWKMNNLTHPTMTDLTQRFMLAGVHGDSKLLKNCTKQ